MLAGHIKMLGGPHVARGPDVAQAWPSALPTISNYEQLSHLKTNQHLL